MTLCAIHDHTQADRVNTYFKPKDKVDCEGILDTCDNPILSACITNGWVEEGTTWANLTVDQYALLLSKAFNYRDSIFDDDTECDQMTSIIIMIMGLLSCTLHRTTGLNIDQITAIRSVDSKVSIQVIMAEMFHFTDRDKTPVLKIVK